MNLSDARGRSSLRARKNNGCRSFFSKLQKELVPLDKAWGETATIGRMKLPFRFVVFFSLLTFVSTFSLHAATSLEKKMKVMKQATKELNTGLEVSGEPDKTANLRHVAKLREAAVAAGALKPAKATDIPEAKRAAFVADYKKSMEDLVQQIDELAQFISAGKWDAARKQMGVLNQSRRDGHKEFMRERE